MWFLLIFIQFPAIQAQDRIALRGSNSPCMGRLEVYYNGQWGLVGHHDWRSENGMVVCKSLGCGDHVKSGIFENSYQTDRPQTYWLDEVRCTGKEERLWHCNNTGWNITRCLPQNFVSVICSGNISPRLNLNGMMNECAGVVQFTTQDGVINVCNQNWTDIANKVCKELDCGKFHKQMPNPSNPKGSSNKVALNCIGNEDFLWQCVDNSKCQEEDISIICTKHNHIRLYGGEDVCEGILKKESLTDKKWVNENYKEVQSNMADSMCAKLKCGSGISMKRCNESTNLTCLKCSDRVKIELRNNRNSKCYGEIYVNVNGSHDAVCSTGTTSNTKIGEVVCQELQCGTPLSVVPGSIIKEGKMSLFDCNGTEKSLWECMYKNGNVRNCQTIKIACSGSLHLQLSNGLDKCAGQLEVEYYGSRWSMTSTDWSKENSDMVCQHLQCGASKESNHYHFVKSKLLPLEWKLECSSSSILNCSMAREENIQQNSVVSILCDNHELWFLEGSSTCEGKVKGETSGYLQNINKELAKEVCRRNLCGGVLYTSESDISNSSMNSTVSPENATSSFISSMENPTTVAPTKPQDAYVKCSGSPMVRLQYRCYGKVLVCDSDNCGVCGYTWTDKQSEMLCKILGCGQVIKETYRGTMKPGVTVASVHCSQTAEDFSQCNFAALNNPPLCEMPAYISCTGSVKAELHDPRDKCAGIPSLFYSGKQFRLCAKDFDTKTQNGFCANFGCGEALSFNSVLSTSEGLATITCQDKNISNCDFSKTKIQECEIGRLKCTGWRRLVLTNVENACKGQVFLQDATNITAVSSDNWNVQSRNELCKYLECGTVSTVSSNETHNTPVWSKTFSCPSKPKGIWDCENEMAPVKYQNQLQITCTDEPDMQLKGNCTGEVWLKKERVCFQSENTEAVFSEFCQMQNCSMFFRTWSTEHNRNARFLRCIGQESKMWQCNSGTSHCKSVVSLACAKAIQLKLSSPCGGDLLVNYRGQWEYVCPLTSEADAHQICRDQKCGNASRISTHNLKINENTDISFSCTKNHIDLKHCFRAGNVCKEKAGIYCDNYVPPVEPNIPMIVVIVVGLVLLLIAVLIMYRKRKTIRGILRFKSSEEDSDMEISENELQSLNEKDDYDDVASVNSIEEDQSDDASEHEEEDASSSQGSSGTEYDDVDEENAKISAGRNPTEPILPPRPNNLLDEVTFEAEVEPQEDYDDVILPQTVDTEQKESLDIPDPSTDPPLLVSNDEAMPQKDE
ncbi:hypothetical protein KOW79_004519 [Hemibagrus wyckioides]|uniref:SRCR domain-containing protein n=1 Tax=Hemibagrus wyckioides TaxID=337641 RepID=A0A9D3P449_9TELE|nr:scavenger receptor cysteine-rich type 1 protein M160 [Hemibagrus wyckioides]KAG7332685.1 hypothetical protein KOW79_004519 [Hemibagrus wyckioides]